MSESAEVLRQRLDRLRQTVRVLLQQAAAFGGDIDLPLAQRHNLEQIRADIAACKAELRSRGVAVDDEPDDGPFTPSNRPLRIWTTGDLLELVQFVPDDVPPPLQLPAERRKDLFAAGGPRLLAEMLYKQLIELDLLAELAEPLIYTEGQQIQIRPVEAILLERRASSVDLVMLFAGMCLAVDLRLLLIVLDSHVLAAVDLIYSCSATPPHDPSFSAGLLVDRYALIALIEQGRYLPIECSGAARMYSPQGNTPELRDRQGVMSFERACAAGLEQLHEADQTVEGRVFRGALDVAALLEATQRSEASADVAEADGWQPSAVTSSSTLSPDQTEVDVSKPSEGEPSDSDQPLPPSFFGQSTQQTGSGVPPFFADQSTQQPGGVPPFAQTFGDPRAELLRLLADARARAFERSDLDLVEDLEALSATLDAARLAEQRGRTERGRQKLLRARADLDDLLALDPGYDELPALNSVLAGLEARSGDTQAE
ncbi:MAG: hypothetical protein OHK0022_21220 [Roseiflexaceae bacterium]